MENKVCLVCGRDAKANDYGYYFCGKHKWLLKFDPEAFEMVVIMRLEGKTPKQIEEFYRAMK